MRYCLSFKSSGIHQGSVSDGVPDHMASTLVSTGRSSRIGDTARCRWMVTPSLPKSIVKAGLLIFSSPSGRVPPAPKSVGFPDSCPHQSRSSLLLIPGSEARLPAMVNKVLNRSLPKYRVKPSCLQLKNPKNSPPFVLSQSCRSR